MHNNELMHFGIKKQKWGVRRFQNKDGSLTPAGRKRYGVDIEGAKSRVDAAKQRKDDAGKSMDYRKVVKASEALAFENDRLSSEKVKARLNIKNDRKSKHRIKLEQKYIEKGMSQEEAEIAAYKRSRAEKIIAAVAGTTIAATAAYVAYKHYDDNVDKVIKSGEVLQNINSDGDTSVKDAFYFSMNKSDNKKYAGLYANQLSAQGREVYKTRISVNRDMKIAGAKNARETLSEIISQNPDNARMLQKRLNDLSGNFPTPKQNRTFSKAISDLKNGRITKSVYDATNMALIGSPQLQDTDDFRRNFYDALTRKGYNGIIDVNDKKYSGYKSKSPIIAFNACKKLAVSSVSKMSDEEISSRGIKEMAKLGGKRAAKQLAILVGGGIAVSKLSNRVELSKKWDEIVSDYREDHPDSKLSYNEILENYYKE